MAKPRRTAIDASLQPHTRTKALHYKRARFYGESAPGLTLAEMLTAALSKQGNGGAALERLGDDSVRLIMECQSLGTMICGHFLDYTDGGGQLILRMDSGSGKMTIDELAPSTKSQFLSGVMYFGVRRNHVMIVQAKGLRAGHFENHLDWLLHEAGVLDRALRLRLENGTPAEIRRQLDVDWVELQADVPAASMQEETVDLPGGTIGPLLRALREIAPISGIPGGRLTPEAAMALRDARLSLRISRQGKGKKRRGPSLVDEIAQTFRNADDLNFKLKTTGGTTLTSEQLKLTKNEKIRCQPSGRLLLDGVAEVMQSWLQELLAHRDVDDSD